MAAIQFKMSVEGSAYCTLSATGKFNFGFTSLPDVYVQLLEVWKGAMIVRLYIDDDGQSRFEDIELPTEDGETISLKQGADLTLTQLSPGDFRDWHNPSRRQYAITLSGQLEIGIGDGTVRRLTPGDLLLAEDMTGQDHTRLAVDYSCLLLTLPLPD